MASWNSPGLLKGIATDADGYVYVSTSWCTCVRKYDPNGTVIQHFGSPGEGDGTFSMIYGVAVAPDGSVYATDEHRHRVQRFAADGSFMLGWGSLGDAPGQFDHPRHLAVDPAGYVYVDDTSNHRVQKFTADGTFVTELELFRGAPSGIDVAPSGELFVSLFDGDRILRLDSDLVITRTWTIPLPQAVGLTVDPDGRVLVVDERLGDVLVYDRDGNRIDRWNDRGSLGGNLLGPNDIGASAGPRRALYVAEESGRRITIYAWGSVPAQPLTWSLVKRTFR